MKKIFSALLSLCLLIGACVMGFFQGIETDTASAASLTETAAEIIVEPQGYSEAERLWQGIPGVEVTKGGRLWVSYFTGGEKEPSTENCVARAETHAALPVSSGTTHQPFVSLAGSIGYAKS